MKWSILVIDDEEGVRELYRLEMEAVGFGVFTAQDGEEALKILREEDVHLVVLDIRLKGENGLALLKTLSEKYPKLPVIISSAYSSFKSDFSSWLAEGYVVKSSDTGQLLAEVERVLRKFYSKGRRKV